MTFDAIIIGAGHNGLTNGAYLAKAGLNVVVLEKNDYIGGASVTREMHVGWLYSSSSYVCSMLRQALHRDLDLSRHGLLLVPYLGTVNFGDDGSTLTAYTNSEANYLELKRHSPHDADSMFRFQSDLGRYAQFIRKTLLRTPPDPTSFRLRDIRELLWLGKRMWALGEKEIYEYVRFFTNNFCTPASVRISPPCSCKAPAIAFEIAPMPPRARPHAPILPSMSPITWWSRM